MTQNDFCKATSIPHILTFIYAYRIYLSLYE